MVTSEDERKCVFVPRPCNVEGDEIPLEVCRLCLNAWKLIGGQINVKKHFATKYFEAKVETPVKAEFKSLSESLAELDKMFAEEEIGIKEYLERRKEIVNSESQRRAWTKMYEKTMLDSAGETFVGLAVVKGGKVEHVYPEAFRLPEGFTAAVKPLYELCKSLDQGSERLRMSTQKFNLQSLGFKDGRLTLLLIGPNQRFEDYEETAENAFKILMETEITEALPRIHDEITQRQNAYTRSMR